MGHPNSRTVFLDRDGVINSSYPSYVSRWEDYVFYPWALRSLRKFREADAQVFLVTNQSGIGRGYFTYDQLTTIFDHLQRQVDSSGGELTDIFFCPHAPDAACSCRKPEPGMLQAAAEKHQVDLRTAWMVGDHAVDIAAGKAVGANTILLQTGRSPSSNNGQIQPDLTCKNLLYAAEEIIKQWNNTS